MEAVVDYPFPLCRFQVLIVGETLNPLPRHITFRSAYVLMSVNVGVDVQHCRVSKQGVAIVLLQALFVPKIDTLIIDLMDVVPVGVQFSDAHCTGGCEKGLRELHLRQCLLTEYTSRKGCLENLYAVVEFHGFLGIHGRVRHLCLCLRKFPHTQCP